MVLIKCMRNGTKQKSFPCQGVQEPALRLCSFAAVVWITVTLFFEVHKTGPSFQPVWLALSGNPALEDIDWSRQFVVNCKLDEGALCHILQVTDKDVKQEKWQYRCLQCCFVTGHQVKYNPLTTNLLDQLSNQFFIRFSTHPDFNVLTWIQDYCRKQYQNLN